MKGDIYLKSLSPMTVSVEYQCKDQKCHILSIVNPIFDASLLRFIERHKAQPGDNLNEIERTQKKAIGLLVGSLINK